MNIHYYLAVNVVYICSNLMKYEAEHSLMASVTFFSFGLYEAMSAIEMMDPKMDVGMVGKRTQNEVCFTRM